WRLGPFGGAASCSPHQRRRSGLGGVELTGGRLEAKALAVALCCLGDLFVEGAVCVIVIPENAGDYHDGCPADLCSVCECRHGWWRWPFAAASTGRPSESGARSKGGLETLATPHLTRCRCFRTQGTQNG